MFKFVELKEVQKHYICVIMNKFKHKEKEISITQMKEYHNSLLKIRYDGLKYGYPNWLIRPKNKISMGVYGFPIPTEDEVEDLKNGLSEQVINIEDYSDFFKQTIKEYSLL